MIRKFLLFIFLIFTILWFTCAYTIKNNIVTLIKNSESDNIKISYDSIKVSGYPINLKVHIIDPKIKFIEQNNSKEISTKKITFLIDLSFKKATLILGNEFKQEESSNDQEVIEYNIYSKQDISSLIKFNKPLYRLENKDNFKSITKYLQLKNNLLSIKHKNEEIFNLVNLTFLIYNINSIKDKNIVLKLYLNYNSSSDFLKFKKAEFDLSSNFTTDNNESVSNKNLTIENLLFSCDDNIRINLTGSLNLLENKIPHGNLSVTLTNYHDIINNLIPDNILISKKMIKMIIENAINIPAAKENILDNESESVKTDTIKFDIELSDEGIKIGSINLRDLKLYNNYDR